MSRMNDLEIAFQKKECATCIHCYMKGFDFYCSEKNDKHISAIAIEDCYVEDSELKSRFKNVVQLLYFEKGKTHE